MVDLKNEVQKRGFKVAHIKTDSIKIPEATPEIIDFVMRFGTWYGYKFEHEATYDRMCLVNDAVYIARYDIPEKCMEKYGYVPGDVKDHPGEWTATGKQFAVPYVFKSLFSHEPIKFEDLCETFSVSGALYLDMNEDLPDVSSYEKELAKVKNGLKELWGLDWEETLAALADDAVDKIGPDRVQQSNNLMMKMYELDDRIAKGHDYHFVGRVGEFCPMIHGGELMRYADGKYSAATGSKGYRWMESEMVKELGKEDEIDRRFYQKLVDDAVEAISKYVDFEWFVAQT